MITQIEQIKRIVKVIKQRFPNLTVEETLDIAALILEELNKP